MSGSSITVNSNQAALNAQRRLGQSTSALSESFTRLSSGLRINKASDDAAGLAISESLNVDARVFNQGVRNLNDGLSVLAIADGAVEQLSNIVIRLEELAQQSANGTLGNEQRKAIDEEAQALSKEYLRIAQSTEFNGRSILRGDFGDLRLQAGYGTEGGLLANMGGAVGDGTFAEAVSYTSGSLPLELTVGDYNNDGFLDSATKDLTINAITIRLGRGDGTFLAPTSYTASTCTTNNTLKSADFNNDGVLDIVSVASGSPVELLLGNGDGTFRARTLSFAGPDARSLDFGDLNSDGILDIVVGNYSLGTTSVLLGNGDGSFRSIGSYDIGPSPMGTLARDFNNDGILDLAAGTAISTTTRTLGVMLGNGDGTFKKQTSFDVYGIPDGSVAGDVNGDGALDIVLNAVGTKSLLLGNGDGSFSAAATFLTAQCYDMEFGDFDGDGFLDLISSNAKHFDLFLGNGDGTFSAATSFQLSSSAWDVSAGDFNNDGVLDLFGANSKATLLLGNSTSGVAPLLSFSLGTQADARQALPVFKQKLAQLGQQRGQIGAFQTRIGVAANTLEVSRENYISAKSQIMDADMAYESAQLVKNNILQQAGAAVLAQANQSPALALKLLGGV